MYTQDGERILDLACGTGLVALLAEGMVRAHGCVIGLDISEGMLNVARHKARGKGSRISFIQCDVSDLKSIKLLLLGYDGFDLITCVSALPLLPDPRQAIKNWVPLLKSWGDSLSMSPP
jgi:ubiquinone/menaquinone biosynthesis C-methylase UbiE